MSREHPIAPTRPAGGRAVTRAALERDALVLSCAISAGVHAALAPEHLREGAGAGMGFVASTALLAGLCLALTYRPESLLAVGGAGAVLAGLIVAYGLAHTTGVPALHPEVEPADGLGLATKAVELVGLAAAAHLTAARRPAGRLTRLHQPKGTTR
jgi:hypothetical protein